MPTRRKPKVPRSRKKKKVSTRRITYTPTPPQWSGRTPGQGIALRDAPRIPQRRELTAQEMASLYPALVGKRPELLSQLARRGVTYYTDPLLGQRQGAVGTYDPSSGEITVGLGQGAYVAAHEVAHAALSVSPINPFRFITDPRYRAAKSADIVHRGGPLGTALGAYLWAGSREGGPSPSERLGGAQYQSEVFAMGAGGAEAYMDLPVDYSVANQLYGGTFDPFALRTFEGRQVYGQPGKTGIGYPYPSQLSPYSPTAQSKWKTYR